MRETSILKSKRSSSENLISHAYESRPTRQIRARITSKANECKGGVLSCAKLALALNEIERQRGRVIMNKPTGSNHGTSWIFCKPEYPRRQGF